MDIPTFFTSPFNREPHAQAWQAKDVPGYEEMDSPRESPRCADALPVTTRSRSIMHLLTMVGVFAVGALAGLGGAWWLMTYAPAANSPMPYLSTSKLGAATEGLGQGRPATVVRGISASELPYDGVPTSMGLTERTPSSPIVEAEAMSSPSQGQSSNQDPVSDVTPDPAAIESHPPETSAEEPPQAPKARSTALPRTGKAANTVRAHPETVTPPARDREIARIKRQAEDELKQKNRRSEGTSSKSPPSAGVGTKQQSPAAASMSKAAEMRMKLARCDQAANIIRREQCRWRLCNGMWGKDGCPSYAAQTRSY